MAVVYNALTGELLIVPTSSGLVDATNGNAGGVGVYDSRVGDTAVFRGVDSLAAALIVALDVPNKKINLDLDADIKAIAALSGIGIPERTAPDTWALIPSTSFRRELISRVPYETTTRRPVAGTYGDATHALQLAVDRIGRVQSISTITISGVVPGGQAGGELQGTYPAPFLLPQYRRILTARVPEERTALRPVAGVYGDATHVAQVQVDRSGRVQSVASVPITISGVSDMLKLRGAFLVRTPEERTSLRPVAGTYGNATTIPQVTVDRLGRVQSVTNVPAAMTDLLRLRGPFIARAPFETTSLRPVAGLYGDATHTARVQTDRLGRIQSVTLVTISGVVPAGAAGGELQGTYPNPTLVPSFRRELVTRTPFELTTRRPTQGAYGDSTHTLNLSVDRLGRVQSVSGVLITGPFPPNGPAGGELAGTYPNPTLVPQFRRIFEARTPYETTTRRPVANTYGDSTHVAQFVVDRLGRVQSASGILITGPFPPNGPAGGELQGTYPNPTLVPAFRRIFEARAPFEITTKRPVAGTYGTGSLVPVITVDRLGRVQSISTTPTVTTDPIIYRRSLLTRTPFEETSRRPVAGLFGDATHVAQVTVDRLGRVQSIANVAISTSGSGTLTGSGVATQVAFWSGATVLTGDNALYWDNVNKALGIGTPTPAFDVQLERSTPAGDVVLDVHQTHVGLTSRAEIAVRAGGNGGGDAQVLFDVFGGDPWVMGLDNSDNDIFKICHSSTLGTNTAIGINGALAVGVGNVTGATPLGRLTVQNNSVYDSSESFRITDNSRTIDFYMSTSSGEATFETSTTDGFQFKVNNQPTFRLLQTGIKIINPATATGTTFVDAGSSNISYTLPLVVVSGVLTNDGAGNLRWANADVLKLRGPLLVREPRQQTSVRPVAGTYGTTLAVPSITVDQNGRVQAVSNVSISASGIGAVTGSGVATQVAFWASAGVLTGDNALYWDNTNKRLGIGTITPGQALEVVGATQGAATLAATMAPASSASAPRLRMAAARGTIAAPSGVLANDLLGTWQTLGYAATLGAYALSNEMRVVADEDFTNLARGSHFEFRTTLIGSTTVAEKMRLSDDGSLLLGTTVKLPGSRIVVSGINGAIQTVDRFISTVATGTAPLVVASTTRVQNLNADMLGGRRPPGLQFFPLTAGAVTTKRPIAGTYGNTVSGVQVIVDASGRVQSVVNVALTGVPPGGSAGGELQGTYPNPTVVPSFRRSFLLMGA